jgi:hypothetical protein
MELSLAKDATAAMREGIASSWAKASDGERLFSGRQGFFAAFAIPVFFH